MWYIYIYICSIYISIVIMGFVNQLTTWRHHRGKIFADEQLIVCQRKRCSRHRNMMFSGQGLSFLPTNSFCPITPIYTYILWIQTLLLEGIKYRPNHTPLILPVKVLGSIGMYLYIYIYIFILYIHRIEMYRVYIYIYTSLYAESIIVPTLWNTNIRMENQQFYCVDQL